MSPHRLPPFVKVFAQPYNYLHIYFAILLHHQGGKKTQRIVKRKYSIDIAMLPLQEVRIVDYGFL
jgi:hypothetical protein